MKAPITTSCSSNSAARKESPTARSFTLSSPMLLNTSLLSSYSTVLSPLFVSFTHAHCFVFVVLPLVVTNLPPVTYKPSYRMLPIFCGIVQARNRAFLQGGSEGKKKKTRSGTLGVPGMRRAKSSTAPIPLAPFQGHSLSHWTFDIRVSKATM